MPPDAVNYTIQRVVKNRLSFPNDDAAMKLIFMALQKISRRWTMPFKNWGAVLHQFSIFYGDHRQTLLRLMKNHRAGRIPASSVW
jgi:transposase-like protein